MTNMRHDSDHWLARYRVAVAPVRARATAAPWPPYDMPLSAWVALLDCLDVKRPFSFLRNVDNVERVRIRTAWEYHKREQAQAWRADCVARYADVRARIGTHVDTQA